MSHSMLLCCNSLLRTYPYQIYLVFSVLELFISYVLVKKKCIVKKYVLHTVSSRFLFSLAWLELLITTCSLDDKTHFFCTNNTRCFANSVMRHWGYLATEWVEHLVLLIQIIKLVFTWRKCYLAVFCVTDWYLNKLCCKILILECWYHRNLMASQGAFFDV